MCSWNNNFHLTFLALLICDVLWYFSFCSLLFYYQQKWWANLLNWFYHSLMDWRAYLYMDILFHCSQRILFFQQPCKVVRAFYVRFCRGWYLERVMTFPEAPLRDIWEKGCHSVGGRWKAKESNLLIQCPFPEHLPCAVHHVGTYKPKGSRSVLCSPGAQSLWKESAVGIMWNSQSGSPIISLNFNNTFWTVLNASIGTRASE